MASYFDRYESAMANKAIDDQRALAESTRLEAERNLIESESQRLEKARTDRRLKQKTFSEYCTFVRNSLLQYVVEDLISEAVDAQSLNEQNVKMMHHFSKQFVNENGGATTILMNAKARSTTPLIEEIDQAVEDTAKEVIAKADKEDPASLRIDGTDVTTCIDKLNKCDDYQEAKEKIAAAVIAAEDQFVNAHTQDKEAMEEIIRSSEEKIAATDQDMDMDAETKEAIKQEAVNQSKQKLKYIRENRSRSVFDEMAKRYMDTVIHSDILRENYTMENGRINSDDVIGSVKLMYSILEAFSICKLQKIDEEYIKNMLDEM